MNALAPNPVPNRSATLDQVLAADTCAGCGGCALLAPGAVRMAMTPPGYLRPVQQAALSPRQERAIRQVCPGRHLALAAGGREEHVLWGPHVALRSGHATDPALRHNGSSGGVLSGLLVHLLQSGAVDVVVQTAASVAEPTGTRGVRSTHRDEVFAAAGSRYAPSAPLLELGRALESGRRIAFVGKPCDVATLRQMARLDPRIDQQVVITLSFFCAGIPSVAGAREVLGKMGVDPGQLAAFRYRGDGWPGFATATLRDGSTARMSYRDSWGGILSRHVQKRCKLCPDGIGSFADLVCADAWHTDAEGYPSFEEGEGTSLVIARTDVGARCLQEAEARGAVRTQPFDIRELEPMQPGQVRKRRFLLARLMAMRALLRWAPRYDGFFLARNARQAGWRQNLRQFSGMLIRELGLKS